MTLFADDEVQYRLDDFARECIKNQMVAEESYRQHCVRELETPHVRQEGYNA
ncbi:hypothetical protein ACWEKM_16945 [Streptomyces sp. NPDC004752]